MGRSERERDLLVVHQLLTGLLEERRGQSLSQDELHKVGRVLRQGPVVQQLKQTQGKEAVEQYVSEVLTKVKKVVEQEQQQSRNQGREL